MLSLEKGLEAEPGSRAYASALENLHRRDLGRNLLPSMDPRFKGGARVVGHGPELVADTRRRTWWEPRAGSRDVRLAISFDHPRRVDTILISGALREGVEPHPVDGQAGPSAPTARFVLRINGRLYPVALPTDRRRKARLELAEPVLLETLELIPVHEGDDGAPTRVRIGEIEAQLR